MNDHKTCGTCRHWGWKFEVDVTLPDAGPLGRVSIKRAPCLIQAVEPDAGDFGVLPGVDFPATLPLPSRAF